MLMTRRQLMSCNQHRANRLFRRFVSKKMYNYLTRPRSRRFNGNENSQNIEFFRGVRLPELSRKTFAKRSDMCFGNGEVF